MREVVLKQLYRLFPFNLSGDCTVPPASGNIRISCIINFYGRLDLLQGILYSLAEQKYPREKFEVLLIEDKGGTEAGRILAAEFSKYINTVHLPLDANYGKMGYSRNFGLAHSKGEITLFLDDDTVILQNSFLSKLDHLFMHSSIDAVIPHGHAVFSCLQDRYDYHDPYFMTSRCTAYKRCVLQELCGFIDNFVGQEDVEFVTRFTIDSRKSMKTDELHYYHPPLLVPNTRKPRAVGVSFFGLKSRYSTPIWLLLLINCARHAPMLLFSSRKHREHGRFGVGFMLGIMDGLLGKKGQVYG